MADFSQYGHAAEEWTSYVRQHAPQPPPRYDSPKRIAESRQITNAARISASRSIIEEKPTLDIQTKTVAIPTSDFQEISARIYRSREAGSSSRSVLVYFHGGGFLAGTLGSEDATCFQLAEACGIVVVSVNYRHTPEWTCPIQFQDAWDARNWVLKNQGQHLLPSDIDLYVGGNSSGACLAASIVIRERLESNPTVKGQFLWCPWLCLPESFPFQEFSTPECTSPIQCAGADLLPSRLVMDFAALLQPSSADCRDPIVNPLLADNHLLESMPPTHIMVCGFDPLRDHGLLYYQKLQHLRIPVRLNVFAGYPHAFRRISSLTVSEEWDDGMTNGISWALGLNT
ncbi:hypothetical protein N7513_003015 [Penicillium frequentans]|nr:hypothetical protein N7513_003015 [Penicillium glabrum]